MGGISCSRHAPDGTKAADTSFEQADRFLDELALEWSRSADSAYGEDASLTCDDFMIENDSHGNAVTGPDSATDSDADGGVPLPKHWINVHTTRVDPMAQSSRKRKTQCTDAPLAKRGCSDMFAIVREAAAAELAAQIAEQAAGWEAGDARYHVK